MDCKMARRCGPELPEVMIEQVDAPALDQVHTREFHDLPGFRLILPLVALALAFLARWFRVVRAREPHAYAVGQKPLALMTEENRLLLDLFDIQLFQGKGGLCSLVLLAAVDTHKADQCPDVRSFLRRHIPHVRHEQLDGSIHQAVPVLFDLSQENSQRLRHARLYPQSPKI